MRQNNAPDYPEKLFVLLRQLRCKRFIVSNHQRGLIPLRNDICRSKSFPRSRSLQAGSDGVHPCANHPLMFLLLLGWSLRAFYHSSGQMYCLTSYDRLLLHCRFSLNAIHLNHKLQGCGSEGYLRPVDHRTPSPAL